MAGGGWGGYHEGAESASYSGSGSFTVSGLKGPATVSGTITCTFDDRGSVSAGPFGSCSCDGYDKSCSAAFSGVHVDPGETYSWSGSCSNDGGPYGGSFSASITSIKYDGCTSEITSDCTSRGLDYAKDSDNYCHCTGCSASVIASCGSKGTKIVQNAEGKDVCVCDKECVEGGACRTSDGVKGEYDAACNCNPKCTPGGDCSKGGKTGTYNKDCECTGECEGGDKTCYGGGTWLKWPDCKCDCSTATPGEYACMKTAGGISFSDTDCSCFCADGQIVQGDGHCQCQQGAFCTTSECGKGHFETDCTCTCDCSVGGTCTDEGVPGHYDKYCACQKDCTPGEGCTENGANGKWAIVDGACKCQVCSYETECRSDGVKGHLDADCNCIPDCSLGGTCTASTDKGDAPGEYNADCVCVAKCTPGDSCTAEIEEGVEAPGTYDSNCDCIAKCTPGEACDMGGGKTGVYDADCNCKCEGQSCAMGTEGGKTDSNCDCYCDKVGNTCSLGEEEGIVDEDCNCRCAAEGQDCSFGTLGGKFDENCDCKCKKEAGDVCGIGEEPAAGVVTEDCGCECASKGAPCDIGTETGEIDENCECKCINAGDPCDIGGRTAAGTVSEECVCECNEKGAPCDKQSVGDGIIDENCECKCSGEEEAKKACEETSDPVWNANHKWNGDTCSCDCSEASLTECDPLYGEWNAESCGCDCIEGAEDMCDDDKHHFEEYPYCKCKCNDETAESNCTNGETPGEWDDLDCKCNCPAGSTLVDGKCKCNEDEKNSCVAKYGEETWCPATCTCCTESDTRKEVCEGNASGYEGDVAGTWNQDRCTCECPTPYVVSDFACKCPSEGKDKCPTSKGATWDTKTCSCQCNSSTLIDLKNKCKTSEAAASGASWDEATCSCTCEEGREFNGTTCGCGKDTDDAKKDCMALARIDPDMASWDEKECKCTCDATKAGQQECTTKEGGKGRYDSDCRCACLDKGKSCGKLPRLKYNSECKCECPSQEIGKSCKTGDNDQYAGKVTNHCECKCVEKAGKDCTTKTGKKGKTNSDCKCECEDTGKECVLDPTQTPPLMGKTWTDCNCVCADAGNSCSNPKGKPGGVGVISGDDKCECVCAEDGTKCALANGNIGKSKDCYCVECDEADQKDCTDKGENWQWNPTGCKCECGLSEAACAQENKSFDSKKCECGSCTVEQQKACKDQKKTINNETCECEECEPDTRLCKGQAKLNEATCECECNEADLEPCPTGYSHNAEYGCQCVCDGDSSTCTDFQKWNELNCKCECNEAKVKRTIPGFCEQGTLDDNCNCDCGTTTADSCSEFQVFNANKCKCECSLSDSNCPTGKRMNDNCECECRKSKESCDSSTQDFNEDTCSCYCKLDIECPANTTLQSDCTCKCDWTASNNRCDQFKEKFDEATCSCVCNEALIKDCQSKGAELDAKCNCKVCEENPSCNGTITPWPDCKCQCESGTISDCTAKGENWKLDQDCNCYCSLSASTCIAEGKKFDSGSCLCICDKQCTDAAKPDLDPVACECFCNDVARGGPDCNGFGFDYTICECKQCKKDEVPIPSECDNEACRRFDPTTCTWICATEEWDNNYANFQAGLSDAANKVSGCCSGFPTVGDIPKPGKKQITCCYSDDSEVEDYTNAAKTQIAKLSNGSGTGICDKVDQYVDDLNDLAEQDLNCPDPMPAIPAAPDTSGAVAAANAAWNYIAMLSSIANCPYIDSSGNCIPW